MTGYRSKSIEDEIAALKERVAELENRINQQNSSSTEEEVSDEEDSTPDFIVIHQGISMKVHEYDYGLYQCPACEEKFGSVFEKMFDTPVKITSVPLKPAADLSRIMIDRGFNGLFQRTCPNCNFSWLVSLR